MGGGEQSPLLTVITQRTTRHDRSVRNAHEA